MTVACGEWSLVRRHEGRVQAIPMRCHKWDCSSCAPANRRRILRCLEATHVDTLMTLTCSRRRYDTPLAAFYKLSASIPDLMKRLRRAFPASRIEYFCVWESTAAGWPHVHVLFRGPFIPQRCLSTYWNELTASPIVDIRRVNTKGEVARYLSKYLMKQPHVPFGHRRFRTSRAFWQANTPGRRNPSPSGEPWRVRRDSIFTLAHLWSGLGYCITFEPPSSLSAHYVRAPPIMFPWLPNGWQPTLQRV